MTIPPKKWAAEIMVTIQAGSPKEAVKRSAEALLPKVREAAQNAGVTLISPFRGDPYLSGGCIGIPAPDATSFSLVHSVIFTEPDGVKKEGWRGATDWLFQALQNVPADTIGIVSITEMRIGA